jgi:tRNA dimethylallyltransferase
VVAALVENPLIVIAGPTASGKTGLALELAEAFGGEIVCCDSMTVYREMEIGTAKPSAEERARVKHHVLDVVAPDERFTAGDFSRQARVALEGITARGKVPIVAGGTGLYLRALIDGLFPAPPQDPALRSRLREKSSGHLHKVLARLDKAAAALIHPNDQPKLVRAIEVSLAARRPMTEQWSEGRDRLTGYRILRLGLRPVRAELYARIDARAAGMFTRGLVEETRGLLAKYGPQRSLQALGYAEACAVLAGETSESEAIARAQQGHRNYAKRQGTWFRREPEFQWLAGFGDNAEVVSSAMEEVGKFLKI